MRYSHARDEIDPSGRVGSTVSTVLRILSEMGVSGATGDSVITAPPFYDRPVLLEPHRFGSFAARVAVHLRFVGYPFEDAAFLTVRQFCEMYVRDSFPPLPRAALPDEQYRLRFPESREARAGMEKRFPICFVLGAPRSGTTLLRAMLDRHTDLWAPGELHLANYETMEERARQIGAILRYMPVPEAAARCRESVAEFSRTFRGWELAATPVADVYQYLHDADPGVTIVDKSPPYCTRRETLERIAERFPAAKFVHIIRSPHDAIRSYVRMQFHRGDRSRFEPGRNPYQAGEAIWFTCNDNVETFLGSLPDDRKSSIRYEDLTSTPVDSLRSICDVLEKDYQPDMANPYGRSGAVAQGAGDPYINLLTSVEHRRPIEPFFELGARCRELAARYAY